MYIGLGFELIMKGSLEYYSNNNILISNIYKLDHLFVYNSKLVFRYEYIVFSGRISLFMKFLFEKISAHRNKYYKLNYLF